MTNGGGRHLKSPTKATTKKPVPAKKASEREVSETAKTKEK